MADVTANLFDAPWRNIPQQQPINWLDLAVKQEQLQKEQLENAQTLAQQKAFVQYGDAAMRGDQDAISKLGAVGAYAQGSLASQIPGHLAQGRTISNDLMQKVLAQTQQQAQTISDPEQQQAFINAKIMDAHNAGVLNADQAKRAQANMSNPAYRNSFVTGALSATDFMKDTGLAAYAQDRAGREGFVFRESYKPPVDLSGYDPVTKKHFIVPTPPTQLPGAIQPAQPGEAGFLPTNPSGSIPGIAPSQSGAAPPPTSRYSNSAADPNALPASAYHARLDQTEGTGQNPYSSAVGRGQFINSTWLDQLSKTHPEFDNLPESQRLAMRSNPTLATEMMQSYAKENASILEAAGVPVNSATLAMAHKLGPKGAISVLQADPNTPMSTILSSIHPNAARSNPVWARQTAGGFVNSTNNQMGTARPDFLPAPTTGGTARDPGAPPVGTADPAVAVPRPQALPPPNADGPQTRLPTTPGATGEPRAATPPAGRAAAAPPPPTPEGAETPAPAVVPPTPAPAAPTAPARPFRVSSIVGDSLGQQVNNHAKVEGLTRVGAPIDEVQQRLAQLPNNYFAGKDVLLSTGISNSPSDPDKFAKTSQMVDDIQTRLGGRAALLGVGSKFAEFNPELEKIAAEKGVPFIPPTGPFTRNDGGVHMQNAGPTFENVNKTGANFYRGRSGSSGPATDDFGAGGGDFGGEITPESQMQLAQATGRPSVQPIPTDRLYTGPRPTPTPAPAAPTVVPSTRDGIILNAPIPKMTEQEKMDYQGELRRGEDTLKDANDLASSAEAGMMNIPQLERAFEQFRTGKTGEVRAQVAAWYNDLFNLAGFPLTDEEKKYAAAGELIRVAGGNLAFDRVRSLGAREAVQVVQQVQNIKPNLLNTPEGNRLILESIKQEFQRALDRREFISNMPPAERAKGMAEFNKTHAPEIYASKVIPFPMPTGVTQDNASSKLKDGVNYNVKMRDGSTQALRYDKQANSLVNPGQTFLPVPD